MRPRGEGDADSHVLLLPEDCDRSCKTIRQRIADQTEIEVAVIINDSLGRAWRNGTPDGTRRRRPARAAGSRGDAGFVRGKLRTTEVGLADEIAVAASLLMGQAGEGTPGVLLRGLQARGR